MPIYTCYLSIGRDTLDVAYLMGRLPSVACGLLCFLDRTGHQVRACLGGVL